MILESFWCKFKKFFSEKTFSNGELCLFFGFLLFWLFTQTEIFNGWDSFSQFCYWGGGILIGWISGRIGMRRLKDLLESAERMIDRPDISIDSKYHSLVAIIRRACGMLGRVFELYNEKQGTTPRPIEKKKD